MDSAVEQEGVGEDAAWRCVYRVCGADEGSGKTPRSCWETKGMYGMQSLDSVENASSVVVL